MATERSEHDRGVIVPESLEFDIRQDDLNAFFITGGLRASVFVPLRACPLDWVAGQVRAGKYRDFQMPAEVN